MTKTRQFLSMCYGDPSATEVPPCCETATKKLTFSTTSVSLSRATIFRRQKNPRRVYRPKIAGILFVCNEPEGKYYTVPIRSYYMPLVLALSARCRLLRTIVDMSHLVKTLVHKVMFSVHMFSITRYDVSLFDIPNYPELHV